MPRALLLLLLVLLPPQASRRTEGGPAGCASDLVDRAGGPCLEASSLPEEGRLVPYPGRDNAYGPLAVVPGGEGNRAVGFRSFVGGGADNVANQLDSTVGGGSRNLADGTYSTVSGGHLNVASAMYATVSGGGDYNLAGAPYTTVGGGIRNYALGLFATASGGNFNQAGGRSSTVSGGGGNEAALDYGTVSGGYCNTASGAYATVAGGGRNVAARPYATVAGGRDNRALALDSFAAGRGARALHRGAFVWGDGSAAEKASGAPNQFCVFASGGVHLFSDGGGLAGARLHAGAGSWSTLSDRALKRDLAPVDGRAVLARLAALPIATWSYRTQPADVRHMGPTAQDFRAAFDLGPDGRTIDTVDADGVALAAIQGLHDLVRAQQAEIAELRGRLERLEACGPTGSCAPQAAAQATSSAGAGSDRAR